MDEREKIVQEVRARMFPEILPAIHDIEKNYPPRHLPAGARVTRIAPSPTGFLHVGGLYTALISERLAHQTGGIFYLRIEDTDKKREVPGASALIAASLAQYGIIIDEGQTPAGQEIGPYGPYTQSARAPIYAAYIKSLLERGLAYPCFCTHEETEAMRAQQELGRMRLGYYGRWAVCRTRSPDDVLEALKKNTPFAIRFRSPGDFNNKIAVVDLLRGTRELSENDQDIVLMKSDGLPTYHLAHVVDDHLMGTTHVIRGDEWLSSVTLHMQLFEMFSWIPPQYGHIAPIQKMDGGSKRKLSKRHDPEASVSFYDERGYPPAAVIEYLLNLANSNFEDWRRAQPDEDSRTFILTFEKLANPSGALFDFMKLNDISKDVVARFSAEEVYEQGVAWARRHNSGLAERMERNSEYTQKIFGIERGGTGKIRKDIAKWSDLKGELEYFFDDSFQESRAELLQILFDSEQDDIKKIIASFLDGYDEGDASHAWFEKIQEIAARYGYAKSAKEYKADPETYKGTVADVAKIFRVALTGRTQTPDLYSIMQVMGKERVLKRLSALA
ncbi:glutamate--tRNA ligase [Candidatus Uhrbacteria bacterium]|nr:glutamate--tRNA ligase [Candidatus Uhrbacteria bacterium]